MPFLPRRRMTVGRVPAIIYVETSFPAGASAEDVAAIMQDAERNIARVASVYQADKETSFVICVAWFNNGIAMYDVWHFYDANTWETGPLCDTTTFLGVSVIKALRNGSRDSLRLLGAEMEHLARFTSVEAYLDSPGPALPATLRFNPEQFPASSAWLDGTDQVSYSGSTESFWDKYIEPGSTPVGDHEVRRLIDDLIEIGGIDELVSQGGVHAVLLKHRDIILQAVASMYRCYVGPTKDPTYAVAVYYQPCFDAIQAAAGGGDQKALTDAFIDLRDAIQMK